MREMLERLLRSADVPNPERAESLWAEYRTGGPRANAAFVTLLAWYGNAVYRRIWGFVRSDAAEDVFQDVLAKLHKERANLDTFDHALRWLRTVAVTQSVDAHRRATRRKARDLRAARPEAESPFERPDELQEVLRVALAKLSAEEREAVALHYFEGLTKRDAAAALGIDRDTLATRLAAALERLQRLIPAPVAVAGGAVALPTVLAAHPPALPPTRLGELIAGAWAAGTGWGLARVAAVCAGLALCGGAVAGWALTREPQQPDEAQSTTPVVPRPETLQEKNIRLVRAHVLPQLLATGETLLPGNRMSLDDIRAFGSEVVVEFVTEKPLPGKSLPGRIRIRYCLERHRLQVWSNTVGRPEDWRVVDPEKPIMGVLRNPFGKDVELRFPSAEFERIGAAFRVLPSDPRARAEMAAHLFGPDEERLEDIPAMGKTVGVAGTGRHHWMLTEHEHLHVRGRFDDGWRLWGAVGARCVAVGDAHLYLNRGADIWARPLTDPPAAEVKVAAVPGGDVARCMTVAGGWLVVRPGGGDERLLVLSPDDPAAGWRALFPGVSVWGLAGHGSRVYGMANDRLVYFDLDAAEPQLIDAGRGLHPPDGLGSLAVWGDRIVLHSERGNLFARPLAAGPDAGWDALNPHPPPKK